MYTLVHTPHCCSETLHHLSSVRPCHVQTHHLLLLSNAHQLHVAPTAVPTGQVELQRFVERMIDLARGKE